jgi:hypothetical protein
VSVRLSVSDPPRVLEPAPASLFQPQLHGLDEGWTALANDCSVGFFDDEGSARRLVLSARMEPPCLLSRLDPAFIDVTYGSAGTVVARHRSNGEAVFDLTAELFGLASHAIVSPDGRYVAAFTSTPASAQVRTVLMDTGTRSRISDEVDLGTSLPGISTALDRLRSAALVLVAERGSATLYRLPFEPDGFTPQAFATTSTPPMAPNASLVTNETEALMALQGGSIAIQPLSGSAMRFLEAPEPGVEDLRIILAPGESRGGVLYSYVSAEGESLLAFRMLVCNR